MSKYLLEDMKKIKHSKRETQEMKEMKEMKETEEKVGMKVGQIKSRSRYMLWFVAFVSVIFFIFALSFIFSKAEIKVNPKIKDIVLNQDFSGSKESNNNNNLPFNLVVISGEENKNIKTIEEKYLLQKAKGIVIIYNTFSSSPQKLNADTRLEGSNDKIYKTENRVVVPGMTEDGKAGSVEVGIYGTEAGQEYNSAPLDFKIFGFKGTPKYSKFYGRSKGKITGGIKGQAPIISDTEQAANSLELKNILQTKLLKKATDQIPEGFILFKNAIFFNVDDTNISPTTEDKIFLMTLKGTLYGFLFNEQKLTKKIVENNIEKYHGDDVYIPNIKDLTFSLAADASILNPENLNNINFNLSGPIKIVWKLEVNKFINSLLSQSKKDFNQILLQYNNIDSAVLTLTPIWKMSIPDKIKDVKVIVNYPK